MDKRIVVVGAGAIGGYTGGNLAHNGFDVTIVDPWPEHVEAIRKHGLSLEGITPEESVEECLFIMREFGFRHLPICADQELLGLVSLRDILLHSASRRPGLAAS